MTFYQEFAQIINFTNYVNVINNEPNKDRHANIKVYVSKGNNGALVKDIFKSRPWVSVVDFIDD